MAKYLNKIFFHKNLQYNLLAFINVLLGFSFIVYLGRKFGVSSQTDTYFFSVVIIVYLGHIANIIWEAMRPYYTDLKIKNKYLSDNLYCVLLNDLFVVLFVIITLYFILTHNFNIISCNHKQFLDIFIFTVVSQNIILLNKCVLNLEHYYASSYFADIFYHFSLLLTIFISEENSLLPLAYTAIISTILICLWQFYLIFISVNIKYKLCFYNSNLKHIYINSFKLKLGSLLYASKDFILASVFTSYGAGTYSLYSYANKFCGVMLQVINAPIINIFDVNANYFVACKNYESLFLNLKKVIYQTIILFTLASFLIYLILPFLLYFIFDNKFSSNDIHVIQKIFSTMVFFYFIWLVQSPFGRLLLILKLFNFNIINNLIFFLVIVISYISFNFLNFNYEVFMYILIFAQFLQFIHIFIKINSFRKSL